jgi:integrase
MAIEKVGIYRKWLEPVPKTKGKPIPEPQWPKRRRHHWIVRWYGTDNKRYGKVFRTRKEAERYASDLQVRVCLGNADKPKKLTLHEFVREHEKVMRGQVAYGTLQVQMRALKLFENFIGGSMTLSGIRPRHAEAFIADRLASEISTSTVNKYIRTLRRVFNLAVEPRGYLREGQNPFAKIKERRKARKPVRYISVEEYSALASACQRLWWKAFISAAYGSGLRRGEILNLMWADIDFEKQLIRVVPKQRTRCTLEWEAKDHENRTVPMTDETAQLFADLQVQAEEGYPYVFISAQRLRRILRRREFAKWLPTSEVINNLTRGFNVIRRRVGLAPCTLHDLRRSAITNWAQSLPIQVV